MSKPADNPADPFKKALAEATKVIADDRDLAVSYTVDPPGVSGDQMRRVTWGSRIWSPDTPGGSTV